MDPEKNCRGGGGGLGNPIASKGGSDQYIYGNLLPLVIFQGGVSGLSLLHFFYNKLSYSNLSQLMENATSLYTEMNSKNNVSFITKRGFSIFTYADNP